MRFSLCGQVEWLSASVRPNWRFWMEHFKEWLETLQGAPHVTKVSLRSASRQQGAYVLWLDGNPPRCLKVGIAGPRSGKGLWERIKFHFSSNPANSVLARHMAADHTSEWSRGHDFGDRAQRQDFWLRAASSKPLICLS